MRFLYDKNQLYPKTGAATVECMNPATNGDNKNLPENIYVSKSNEVSSYFTSMDFLRDLFSKSLLEMACGTSGPRLMKSTEF